MGVPISTTSKNVAQKVVPIGAILLTFKCNWVPALATRILPLNFSRVERMVTVVALRETSSQASRGVALGFTPPFTLKSTFEDQLLRFALIR